MRLGRRPCSKRLPACGFPGEDGLCVRPQAASPFWPSGLTCRREACAKFSSQRSPSIRFLIRRSMPCCTNWNSNRFWLGGRIGCRAGLGTLLSVGEQRLLAFVHMFLSAPRFVFLDRAGTALSPSHFRKVLRMLSDNAIACLSIDTKDDLDDLYDAVLEINELGTWRFVNRL